MTKKGSRGHTVTEKCAVCTAGAILPKGCAVDIVRPKGGDLRMLLWAGGRATVATKVQHSGVTYRPLKLSRTLLASTRFPEGLVDQGITNLLAETQELFESHIGLGAPESALIAAWVASTWFPDCLSNVPTLVVHGFDENVAMILFRILHCVCRRALILTELQRSTLSAIMDLKPTLIVVQPEMPRRLGAMLMRSNHRRLVVPVGRGEVVDLTSSKAIFAGAERNVYVPDTQSVHVTLSPVRQGYERLLNEIAEDAIAKRFQARYLAYRLQNFQVVRQSEYASNSPLSPGSLPCTLSACTLNNTRLKSLWLPLLESQQQDVATEQLWDPCAAMAEVLWPLIHSSKAGVQIRELTQDTNVLLRTRGENRQYNDAELGTKLTKLGLYRHRKSAGMFLLFDRATCKQLHCLAPRFGITSTHSGCLDCNRGSAGGQRKGVKNIPTRIGMKDKQVM